MRNANLSHESHAVPLSGDDSELAVKRDLLRMLRARRLVGDGAMGTQLQYHGLETGGLAELFNVERPQDVLGIHQAYRSAGAELILTNSFNGNRLRLAPRGLGDRTRELNLAAVRLARQAAGSEAWVLGDIGPSGRAEPPRGEEDCHNLRAAFVEQATSLAEGGVDAILIETMPSLAELAIAVEAAKATTRLPVLASMFFRQGGGEYRTLAGEDCETVARRVTEFGADAAGANCGGGIDEMIEIIRRMRPATTLPIVARPSAGLPRVVEGKPIYPQPPEFFAVRIAELLAAGPNIVGGCCGTTPEHIALIARAANAHAGG